MSQGAVSRGGRLCLGLTTGGLLGGTRRFPFPVFAARQSKKTIHHAERIWLDLQTAYAYRAALSLECVHSASRRIKRIWLEVTETGALRALAILGLIRAQAKRMSHRNE